MRTVRVLADAGNKELPTVNIVTSGGNVFETCAQAPGAANTQFETVQDSGGTVAGLKTIIISGYTGPA